MHLLSSLPVNHLITGTVFEWLNTSDYDLFKILHHDLKKTLGSMKTFLWEIWAKKVARDFQGRNRYIPQSEFGQHQYSYKIPET